ncbi:MAG: hypothetical protein U1A22_00260 [Xanthomonadaceae bacterium]|nr:hypothetical protein [Xanthomonadaceae bacterium]
MSTPLRVVLSAAAFVMVYLLCFLAWLMVSPGGLSWLAGFLGLLGGATATALAWRHAGSAPDSAWKMALYGAALVGAIGFVGGFFGPMIFAPDANQGPLLGLLITGPGGAVLGAVGGLLYGLGRGRRG